MIFVDTGYLFALLDRRDQLHHRAAAWQRVLREPLLTTEYVVWELLNGFSAIEDRSKGHDAFDNIRSGIGWMLMRAAPDLFDAGATMLAKVLTRSGR